MKRIFTFIIALLFLLTACGQTNESAQETDKSDESNESKLNVITTVFAPYDFAKEILGDKANVSMLTSPGAETHSYEPTPKDIIRIQNCDVFIYVGGESDAWVDDILASMDTEKIEIITLIDCVPTVEEEIVEGMEHNHEHDDHEHDDHGHDEHDNHGHDEHDDHEHDNHEHDEHGHDEHDKNEDESKIDEHVWTSPKNAKLIVEKISSVFCELDAENSAEYESNTAEYILKLDELDAKFQDVVDNAARKTIILGDRFPFRYFVDAYELSYFAAFPGCSDETEASAATIAFLIDKVKDENIPVVFHAEMSNKKMAEVIGESANAEVLLLHSCHNVSKDELESGATYLDLMNQNVENLRKALK